MKNSHYWSLSVALLLGGCSGNWDLSSDRVRSTFHEVVPVRIAHSVRVTNISGKINVLPWDRADVEVDALLHAADVDSMRRLHVDVSNDGTTIRVATRYGDGGFLNIGKENNGYIDYTIHMPRTLAVNINNVSGAVIISGIHNDVSVRNVSGSVDVRYADGELDLDTTSGDITADVVSVKAGEHMRLGSISGSVKLTVPKNAAAGVKASSISGGFTSTFPVQSEDRTVGSHVDDKINGGSTAQLSFSTVSGAMTLTGK